MELYRFSTVENITNIPISPWMGHNKRSVTPEFASTFSGCCLSSGSCGYWNALPFLAECLHVSGCAGRLCWPAAHSTLLVWREKESCTLCPSASCSSPIFPLPLSAALTQPLCDNGHALFLCGLSSAWLSVTPPLLTQPSWNHSAAIAKTEHTGRVYMNKMPGLLKAV